MFYVIPREGVESVSQRENLVILGKVFEYVIPREGVESLYYDDDTHDSPLCDVIPREGVERSSFSNIHHLTNMFGE